MAKNDSFFNEIYGTYFNVVSSILRQAQEKQLTKDSLELLVREQAFADSCLTIPKAGRQLAAAAEGYDYAAKACAGYAVDNAAAALAEKLADR